MTDVAEWDFPGKFIQLAEKLYLKSPEVFFLNAFAQFMADTDGVGDLEGFRMQFASETQNCLGHNTSHQLVDILEDSGLAEAARFNAIKIKLVLDGEIILPGEPPQGDESGTWYQSDFDHDESLFGEILTAKISGSIRSRLQTARDYDNEIARELAGRIRRSRRLSRR